MTGALGAGKTTLVRHLLATPEGAGCAVVVNEFADLGIDQHLLGDAGVALLANGCFCCRSQSDLATTLLTLFDDRRAGRIPDFRRVIVETSGLGDPGAVLLSLASDPGARRLFRVETVVALVDATTATAESLASDDAQRQLALADLVLVTKGDLAGLDALDGVRERLDGLAPGTTVLDGRHGTIDPALLFDRADTTRPAPKSLRPPTHSRSITRHVLTRTEPVDLAAFLVAMEALAALRAPDILRIKGWLRVHGRERPVLYHRVQHVAHAPTELEAWPDGERTQLVFITRNLAPAVIDAVIDAVQGAAIPAADTPSLPKEKP